MKKFFLLLIVVFATTFANAQFAYLNDVQLDTDGDFQEYVDVAIDCCDYLLLTPFDKKDVERQAATAFIIRWININPAYSFEVTKDIRSLTQENEELVGLYTICCVKLMLDAEAKELTGNLQNEAINSFIAYCSNPMNKIKLTKEIKKIINEG